VWGDRRLDALQFTLLLATVFHTSSYRAAGTAPKSFAPAPIAAADDGPGGKAFSQFSGYVEGLYEQEMQIPITPETARKQSICASLILYGHKTTVKVDPYPIWHRQLDGGQPHLAVLTATMTFEDDYYNNYYGPQKDLLDLLECKLPRKGPVEDGHQLEWDAQEPLPEHGRYDLAATLTKDGMAVATFRAIDETTPASRRIFKNQRDVNGRVSVQAKGFLGGMENLEAIVTWLRETGTLGKSNLAVNYYVDPCKQPPPGGDETCELAWVGTTSVTSAGGTNTASVSFTHLETIDGVAKFVPSGTVTASVPGCTITPATHVLTPEEGELNIDHNTPQATYYGAGTSTWMATVDCGGSPGPSFVGGAWFSVNLDPRTQIGPAITDNGTTMSGSDNTGGLMSTWNLTAQSQ
jgi:hypothetical protein